MMHDASLLLHYLSFLFLMHTLLFSFQVRNMLFEWTDFAISQNVA
jgi:hypothetical protein